MMWGFMRQAWLDKIVLCLAFALVQGVVTLYVAKKAYDEGYEAAYAKVNEARIKQIAAAQEETDRWKQQVEQAEKDYADKLVELDTLTRANSSLRTELVRLRVNLKRARSERLSSVAGQACHQAAVAYDTVFGECAERLEALAGQYAELAAVADRHAADVTRLLASWPVE